MGKLRNGLHKTGVKLVHIWQKWLKGFLIAIWPYLAIAAVFGVICAVLTSGQPNSLELSIDIAQVRLPGIGAVPLPIVISAGILLFCVAFLLFFNGYYMKKRMRETPHGLQNLIELLVTSLDKMTQSRVGQKIGAGLSPYLLALGAYIALGSLVELFGIQAMTADLNTTLALGLCTFIMINVTAIRYRGLRGRIRYYGRPMKLVAPFKLLSDVCTPISLACRLYGNILAGAIVMELLYFVTPILIPGIMSLYFNLFHAGIQVYIFMYLSLSFIGEALE